MVKKRGEWEDYYQKTPVSEMPWFHEDLDRDIERALAKHAIEPCRALDLGTGPGTQAVELAARGFHVTASDLSPSAIRAASGRAVAAGVRVDFRADDILESSLEGPFDLILDRGCFHVLPPKLRGAYVEQIARLTSPRGLVFLKTFSVKETSPEGPHRFSPEELRSIFEGPFEIVSIRESVFEGAFEEVPKALFAVLRRQS